MGIPTNGFYECEMNDLPADFMLLRLDVISNRKNPIC